MEETYGVCNYIVTSLYFNNMRGFEIVSTKANDGLNLPKRSTQAAAGYDFEASEDVVIPSALSNHFLRD